MDKANKVMAFVLSIVGLIDILLRCVKTPYVSFLTTQILPLNILEIVIVLMIIALIYRFLPGNLSRLKCRMRSECFWKNWEAFKELLDAYSETNDDKLQSKYLSLRGKLESDFNFFVPSIKSIQEASHRKEITWYINKLEDCFRAKKISDWESKSGHNISNGIDYLDYLVV